MDVRGGGQEKIATNHRRRQVATATAAAAATVVDGRRPEHRSRGKSVEILDGRPNRSRSEAVATRPVVSDTPYPLPVHPLPLPVHPLSLLPWADTAISIYRSSAPPPSA